MTFLVWTSAKNLSSQWSDLMLDISDLPVCVCVCVCVCLCVYVCVCVCYTYNIFG
jgi:hypothetical protein